MISVTSAREGGRPDGARRVIEPSQHAAARVAGFWYLFAMAVGMFAELYAHGQLVVPSDAVQTAKNIAASEWLFRLGTVSHLVVFAGDVVLLVALYVILRPINGSVALLAAAWRLAGCCILAVALLSDFATLRLLSGVEYLNAFNTGQLQALARLFISVHSAGFQIGFVFLGLGSTIFSYLWLKSRYIPRALAAWGIFSSLALAVGTLIIMVFPEPAAFLTLVYMLPMFFYEVGLGLWLIFKGIEAPHD
ncbi:MAG: DUF4386 domain-containing protein [Burkholderiales bacterium]